METRGGTRQRASFWAGCYENHQNGRVHHCTVGIFRGKKHQKNTGVRRPLCKFRLMNGKILQLYTYYDLCMYKNI